MKKLVALLLAVVLVLGLMTGALAADGELAGKTVILHTNASSGSTYRTPLVPSTIANFPSTVSSSATSVPIRAGMLIVRARIAVWELTEPCTVTKDSTLSFSSCTVSDGAKSSARIITGSSVWMP